MKKLLIMLMVVAMASFLFVGCLGVAPDIDDEEDEGEPGLPPSTIPVISAIGNISLYPTTTQYVKGGFTVTGYAPKYSEVQIYVDGAVVSTGYAWGVTEEFKISVSKTSLGVDGAKTLYATATGVGLEESDASTTYKFTLDTVAPKIASVTAETEEVGVDGTITVTFSEALDADTVDEDEDYDIDWAVKMWGDDLVISGIELISPKVVELETNFLTHGAGGIIRVTYEDADAEEDDPTPITDLAGNSAVESIEYGYLELEEEEEVAVTGVTLNKATTTLAIGATETLVETVAPTGATDTSVIWASSVPEVAAVIDGEVIALTVGATVITVTTVDGGFIDFCVVTVQ